jgi:hypothetical protein
MNSTAVPFKPSPTWNSRALLDEYVFNWYDNIVYCFVCGATTDSTALDRKISNGLNLSLPGMGYVVVIGHLTPKFLPPNHSMLHSETLYNPTDSRRWELSIRGNLFFYQQEDVNPVG